MNRLAFLLVLAFLFGTTSIPNLKAADVKTDREIRRLIDKLAEVADADHGYSPHVFGNLYFSPIQEGHFHGGLLFQKPSVPSDTLRQLVKQGAVAVPLLLEHLDDKRKTRLAVSGPVFEEDWDYNPRTDNKPEGRKRDRPDRQRTSIWAAHTVTVGDLCYVALGQILNRNFISVRYQPTMIIIVQSPTHSPVIAAAVRKQWAGLTPEKHRASLLADFTKPDHEARRFGAAQRLAYYFPEALETPALAFLAEPSYDWLAIHDFVFKTLYRTTDPKERARLFNEFVEKHGKPSRVGIERKLFDDLNELEADEEKRLFPPLKDFGTQPRELLIQLYDRPKSIRSSDRPKYPAALSNLDEAELINGGLIYDESEKIDRAVRDLLLSHKDDDTLAPACVARLVGRGYDRDIEECCRRLLPRVRGREREALEAIRDKLGWTRLHVAVEQRWHERVASILKRKPDLDAMDRAGRTPLHVAARAGDQETVRRLLDAKANPNAGRDSKPVQAACEQGHLDVVDLLVARGASIPDVFVAAAAGAEERLRELLREEPVLARKTNPKRQTPLHLSSMRGHTQCVRLLLSNRIDVDAEDQTGGTALHYAAYRGQEGVVRVLLAHKADIHGTHRDSKYLPLQLASLGGNAKVVELLLDAEPDSNGPMRDTLLSALHLAAAQGHAEVVSLLLKRGADPNGFDRDGKTALHLAAMNGRLETARMLLKHRANVDARKEQFDQPPLFFAVKEGHLEVVKLLFEYKASTATIERDLRIAEMREHEEIVKFLKSLAPKK